MNKNPCNSKGCTDFFVCYNFWRWRFAVFHLAFLRAMRDKQPTEYKAKSLTQGGTVY